MRFYKFLNESTLQREDIINIPFLSYDSRMRTEAEYFSLDKIKVGKSFFELPDKEAQLHVLLHEIGHYVSDITLNKGIIWEWSDKGYFVGDFNGRKVEGLNGHTVPGEFVSEAFAVYLLEPDFLRQYYNEFFQSFSEEIKSSEYKEAIAKAKEILKQFQ